VDRDIAIVGIKAMMSLQDGGYPKVERCKENGFATSCKQLSCKCRGLTTRIQRYSTFVFEAESAEEKRRKLSRDVRTNYDPLVGTRTGKVPVLTTRLTETVTGEKKRSAKLSLLFMPLIQSIISPFLLCKFPIKVLGGKGE
jgi:hypothetical protein